MDMTPQKLADWLQDKTIYLWDSGDEQYYASPICEDIVPMLRQQQAEIEALKYEKSSGVYDDEPVAWMHHCLKSGIGYLSYTKPPPLDDYKPIPLYTHPAKTLTDEEIKQVWQSNLVAMGNDLDFARAILRKAQEK